MQQTIFGIIMITALAIMFLSIIVPAFFTKPDSKTTQHYVLAIDSGLPGQQQTFLNYLDMLYKRNLTAKPRVVAIILDKGVSILQNGANKFLPRLRELQQTGVEFYICNKSLLQIPAIKPPLPELVPGFKLVEDGRKHLNQLMDEGYTNDFA